MGRLYTTYLEGRVYSCKCCKEHLANIDELVSKSFHCRNGKAYLFNTVVNIETDIYCNRCSQVVGWKYEQAYEKSQKYKEGKFILERSKVTAEGRFQGGLLDLHGSDGDNND